MGATTPTWAHCSSCRWHAAVDFRGVYVSANIRGGGEFGPEWHQAALKEKRHKAYEDFIAVGEQLIERGITSSPRLAVEGGSNGGLLVGNMLHMAPKLWGAIVCQVGSVERSLPPYAAKTWCKLIFACSPGTLPSRT